MKPLLSANIASSRPQVYAPRPPVKSSCVQRERDGAWPIRSVVGIFSGREDNVFWRRTRDSIEAHGARTLGPGETTMLGAEAIHSVVNPLGKRSRALHVYGGDFFAPARPRSEWDHEALLEKPWDMEDTRRLFAEAELRFRAGAEASGCS